MRVSVDENEQMSWFEITPETLEEAAMLMRIANNTRSDKPEVRFRFPRKNTGHKDPMQFEVTLAKVSPSNQNNFIGNGKY